MALKPLKLMTTHEMFYQLATARKRPMVSLSPDFGLATSPSRARELVECLRHADGENVEEDMICSEPPVLSIPCEVREQPLRILHALGSLFPLRSSLEFSVTAYHPAPHASPMT